MKTGRISWVYGVLFFAVTACSGGTDPDTPELLASIDYAPRGAAAGVQPPPNYEGTAAVAVEAGALRITTTVYGDLCRVRPTAGITQAGGRVTLSLQLEALAWDVNCPQWIAETDVTAQTVGLAPGQYTAQVRVKYWDESVQALPAGGVIIE